MFDGVVYKKERKFTVDNGGVISAFYNLTDKLGAGSFGSVRKGVSYDNGAQVGVKTIPKKLVKDERMAATDKMAVNATYGQMVDREMELLRILKHPNIIKMMDSFEDEDNLFIVLELCEGGEVVDVIIDQGSFSEHQARFLMKQLYEAVAYMHDQGIMHRDLKLANCLLTKKGPVDQNVLKVIDFGLAAKLHGEQALRAPNGTPYFMAPQVLKGMVYDASADLWSCGVIMYVLLCGYPPFDGRTTEILKAKVQQGNYCFSEADWSEVSQEAKDMLRGLLKMTPKDRLTARQAKEHTWCQAKDTQKLLPSSVLQKMGEWQNEWRIERAKEEAKIAASRQRKKADEETGVLAFLGGLGRLASVLAGLVPASVMCCADTQNAGQYVRKGSGVEFVEVGHESRDFMVPSIPTTHG